MAVGGCRVCGVLVGAVGARLCGARWAEHSAANKLAPRKKKNRKKRKKECKTEGVNRATRKVFWKKYSFRAKRGKEDFFQKPEGLDLAGARREAIFAIPFWLIRFEGQFAQSESIKSDNHH